MTLNKINKTKLAFLHAQQNLQNRVKKNILHMISFRNQKNFLIFVYFKNLVDIMISLW